MKILVTNHHLRDRAGSELFTLSLAVGLKDRGHEVSVFSFDLGAVSEEIKRSGISVTDFLDEFRSGKFDVIHAQHNLTAIIARSVFPNTPMVFMSHGVLPELEQAPSVDLGISRFIAASEEIKSNLIRNCKIAEDCIEIVRNFVDTGRFCPKKPLNSKPKRILVISNHYADHVKNVIEEASNDLNITVTHIGLPENPVVNVEEYINEADIVVSLGRGVLEAMACERNVIVYDVHGADGFIDGENFFEVRKCNFSGRRFGKKLSAEGLKNEIARYNPEVGKKLREIVLRENSTNTVVGLLEDIYLESTSRKDFQSSQIKSGQLYGEIFFLEKYFKAAQDFPKILTNEIQHKEQEIALMKSSKFWKLLDRYTKIKKHFLLR